MFNKTRKYCLYAMSSRDFECALLMQMQSHMNDIFCLINHTSFVSLKETYLKQKICSSFANANIIKCAKKFLKVKYFEKMTPLTYVAYIYAIFGKIWSCVSNINNMKLNIIWSKVRKPKNRNLKMPISLN